MTAKCRQLVPITSGRGKFLRLSAKKGACTMKYSELKLGQIEALVNVLGGMEIVMRLISGVAKAVIQAVKRLKKVDAKPVSGAKKFVITEERLGQANIGYFGDNFKKYILGCVVEEVGDTKITIHKLDKSATAKQMMDELGADAIISFAHFLPLIEKQSRGEKGVLLTNLRSIISFIVGKSDEKGKENEEKAWAVRAYFSPAYGCWHMSADPMDDAGRWNVGGQVLSSDSGT